MKKYTINTKTTYEKNGETKTTWNRIGRIVQFDDGSLKTELFMFPETQLYTFEDKPKEDEGSATPF